MLGFLSSALIALIAARKLDCLLLRACAFGPLLELCSRRLAQVGRSNDGTLVHLKQIVFVSTIIEYEFKPRTCNATLFCSMQIMTETYCLRYCFGCG